MNRFSLILLGPFLSVITLAEDQAGSAHAAAEGHHGIPWGKLVIPQAINFAIFAGILIFLLRKPVKEFFASKGKDFLDSVKKAEEVKASAERAHGEIQTRLRTLESTATQNVKEAEVEAAALRTRLIKEAQEAAIKAEQEAVKTIHYEHERAIAALSSELVANSVRFAQEKVAKSLDSNVIDDLQAGFSKKVQSVRQ